MPVYVAGRAEDGQLGLNQKTSDSPITLNPFFADKRIVSAAVGSGHTLLLSDEGIIYACGRGDDGRLGQGNKTGWLFDPTKISYFENKGITVASIACGSYHSCAITLDGTLYTWGGSLFGKLGHGDELPCWIPKRVSALNQYCVVQVACGSRHTIVLTQERELFSFGDTSNGVLGLGPVEGHMVKPQKIKSLANVDITVVAACGAHNLALTSSGEVYSWGAGLYGRCGHGDEEDVLEPKKIEQIQNATDISAGGFHSAAVLADGSMLTWGGGEHGQLGDGGRVNVLRPQHIESVHSVATVTCGWSHTLCLTEDGEVFSTGNADHMKIPVPSDTFLLVQALSGLPVTSVSTYNEHVVYLTAPCGRAGPFRIERQQPARQRDLAQLQQFYSDVVTKNQGKGTSRQVSLSIQAEGQATVGITRVSEVDRLRNVLELYDDDEEVEEDASHSNQIAQTGSNAEVPVNPSAESGQLSSADRHDVQARNAMKDSRIVQTNRSKADSLTEKTPVAKSTPDRQDLIPPIAANSPPTSALQAFARRNTLKLNLKSSVWDSMTGMLTPVARTPFQHQDQFQSPSSMQGPYPHQQYPYTQSAATPTAAVTPTHFFHPRSPWGTLEGGSTRTPISGGQLNETSPISGTGTSLSFQSQLNEPKQSWPGVVSNNPITSTERFQTTTSLTSAGGHSAENYPVTSLAADVTVDSNSPLPTNTPLRYSSNEASVFSFQHAQNIESAGRSFAETPTSHGASVVGIGHSPFAGPGAITPTTVGLASPSTRLAMTAITGGISGPTSAYLHDLHHLLNNPNTFPDLTIHVQGCTFVAHRCILATRCPTFAAMLGGLMREARECVVTLPDFDPQTVLNFLHYVYTDTLVADIDVKAMVALWRLADSYLCDRLRWLCEKRIRKEIMPDNAAIILATAERIRSASIRAIAMNFISSNFDLVVKKPDSLDCLSKELVIELLKRRAS